MRHLQLPKNTIFRHASGLQCALSARRGGGIAAASLLLSACGAAEDATLLEDYATDETIGRAEQAFGTLTCATVGADSVHDISSFNFSVTHTTPDTYNNPNAFKAYIWDLKANTTSAAHFNSVNYSVELNQTANGAFRPTHSDTRAECEGITLKTKVFFEDVLVHEDFDRGLWDFGGCYLPREIAPVEIGTTRGSHVRICATARRSDETVIPMKLLAHGAGHEDLLYGLNNPRIPFTVDSPFGFPSTTIWEKVGWDEDGVSADAYCVRHGFNRGVAAAKGSCTVVVAKYDPALQTWSQVSGGCQAPLTTITCQ